MTAPWKAHRAAHNAAAVYGRPAPCEPSRLLLDCSDCPRRRTPTPDSQAWRSQEVRIDGSVVTLPHADGCVVRGLDLERATVQGGPCCA